MKYILIILVSILSLTVCSIIYIGESNSYKYEPRYFLGYSKGENYILDNKTLYSYGKTGFLKIDLILDQIYYLFDEETDENYKKYTLNNYLIEKKELEKEQKPIHIHILSSKADLTSEEQDIYNRLKDKKMRYPNRSIIVKVK
ncbi:MAG: hypothetical protein KHZ00_08680 [Veillonella sp.]|nr:hypothetical protein [Veillonella sp.]